MATKRGNLGVGVEVRLLLSHLILGEGKMSE
jgi:hypothetical protein